MSEAIISRRGGGANLNFKVLGGTSQPASPKENTIWVNTDTAITSWFFSATEPENPVEGMVWIKTGKASGIPFNALKKNTIIVYPQGVMQYASGTWEQKTAEAYQSGAWMDLLPGGALYWLGNQFESITGGWKASMQSGNSGGTITVNDDFIRINKVSGGNVSMVSNNKIDMSGYSTLYVDVDATTVPESVVLGVASTNSGSSYTDYVKINVSGTGRKTLSVDIVSVTSGYPYVRLTGGTSAGVGSADVYKVWME